MNPIESNPPAGLDQFDDAFQKVGQAESDDDGDDDRDISESVHSL